MSTPIVAKQIPKNNAASRRSPLNNAPTVVVTTQSNAISDTENPTLLVFSFIIFPFCEHGLSCIVAPLSHLFFRRILKYYRSC